MGGGSSIPIADRPKVVIIGGGYAGVTAARKLDETKQFYIILIERKNYFLHNVGALRAAVQKQFSEQIVIPYDKLLKNGTVIQAEVTQITPQEVFVHGRNEPFHFQYLIIATGSSYAFPIKISEPMANNVHTQYETFRQLVHNSERIGIIGGGPVGIELAGEIATEWPKSKQIFVIHPHERVLSNEFSNALKDSVEKQLRDLGCTLLLGQRVVEPSSGISMGKYSYLTGPITLKTDKQNEQQVDLLVFCTGTRINNTCFQSTFASELTNTVPSFRGRLRVNEYLQVSGAPAPAPAIFAIGDCAAIETKMAYYAGKQGEYVAKTILALNNNKSITPYVREQFPAIFLSIGRNGGASQLPNESGTILGAGLSKYIKSRGMFVDTYWKLLRDKPTHSSESPSQPVSKDPKFQQLHIESFQQAMAISAEEAQRLIQGLPANPKQDGQDYI